MERSVPFVKNFAVVRAADLAGASDAPFDLLTAFGHWVLAQNRVSFFLLSLIFFLHDRNTFSLLC
jgi:hypothetical protein